ncbi:MAG: PTS sugar transporter subunit IIA [Thermodesulfobacteriota bacterium]
MELGVKKAANLLNVSEKTIYRMVKNQSIPCFKIGGLWRFSERELLQWVRSSGVSTPSTVLPRTLPEAEIGEISISSLLLKGGIYYRVAGDTREDVIRNSLISVKKEELGENIERLFEAIMKRENLCSTAIGHGIAMPHPRPFGEFMSRRSSISICFLESPIAFDSLDGEDVYVLFFIFPQSEERYLKIQSRLLRLLKEADLLSKLNELPLRPRMLELIKDKESEVLEMAK